MTRVMTTYPQKVTFGEMRESGVRDVLIYRRDPRCSHCIEISAEGLALCVQRLSLERIG